MSGKAKIKRVMTTKSGEPARVLTFTARPNSKGVFIYFVHRYNADEFSPIIGKSETEAHAWLVAQGYHMRYITGR